MNSPQSPANSLEPIPPRKAQIRRLLDALNQDLFEKEKAVGLSLLTALAGESIFLLGPPGVAKSLIARRLKYAFEGAAAFEYLMGKFSTPDEIFGPVSISKLKNEDRYERLTEAYLPGANIVFLDEIWKASPPIQNALLTVLNEKIYLNGAQEIRVDIRGLIAASNELPQPDEGLEALWDRFLVRLIVGGIESKDLFEAMITLSENPIFNDPVPKTVKITDDMYREWGQAIRYVFVPPQVTGVTHAIRSKFREYSEQHPDDPAPYISDRRWRHIIQLLRTSAFLNDREEVDLMDCALIADCLWHEVDQIEWVRQVVEDAVINSGYGSLIDLQASQRALDEFHEDILGVVQQTYTETSERPVIHTDEHGIEFVRIPDFWGNTDAFLRRDDYQKLKKEGEAFVGVYERSQPRFRPFQSFTIRFERAHEIIYKERVFSLHTDTVEVTRTRHRTADNEKREAWREGFEKLDARADRAIDILSERNDRDKVHWGNHLFVPSHFANTVVASLDHATEAVLNYKLEIEKLVHRYLTDAPA